VHLLKKIFPAGVLTDLISRNIPELWNINLYTSNCLLLFLFIFILEESGYMSRVVFLMDKSCANLDYQEKRGAFNFRNGLCYPSYHGNPKYRKTERTHYHDFEHL
jgi:hypothetical protein